MNQSINGKAADELYVRDDSMNVDLQNLNDNIHMQPELKYFFAASPRHGDFLL